ncbi:MAG: hypothetical protein ACREQ5_29195, partial [Candidatus Dormibacteria bacterium]
TRMSDAVCNGFKLRGLNQDAGRVAVQSNVQTTWMLTRHRSGTTKPIEHEVGMTKNELIVIKCQDGAGYAAIELKPLGDAAGTLIAESSRKATKTLRVGSKYRFELDPGEALVLRSTAIVHPTGPGAGMMV